MIVSTHDPAPGRLTALPNLRRSLLHQRSEPITAVGRTDPITHASDVLKLGPGNPSYFVSSDAPRTSRLVVSSLHAKRTRLSAAPLKFDSATIAQRLVFSVFSQLCTSHQLPN